MSVAVQCPCGAQLGVIPNTDVLACGHCDSVCHNRRGSCPNCAQLADWGGSGPQTQEEPF